MTVNADFSITGALFAIIVSAITYYAIRKAVKEEIAKGIKGVAPGIVRKRVEDEQKIERIKTKYDELDIRVKELDIVVKNIENRLKGR